MSQAVEVKVEDGKEKEPSGQRIREYTKKILDAVEKYDPEKDTTESMVFRASSDATYGIFEQAGFNESAIRKFGEVMVDVARASHHAATELNIQRIKNALSKGKDATTLKTRVLCKMGRNIMFSGMSTTQKSGSVTTPKGERMDWTNYNYGQAGIVMTGSAGDPEYRSEQISVTKKELGIKDDK